MNFQKEIIVQRGGLVLRHFWFWEKVTLSNFAVCSEFSTENNSYNAKVHSFSKQCFAQSSFDTILGDFQLIFKLSSANIS